MIRFGAFLKKRIDRRGTLRGIVASAALCATVCAPPTAAASAQAPRRTYVNPFAYGGWGLARTDMGVDYLPLHPEPVVAIGDAKILGSSSHSGWPGGHLIWYQLLHGSHAGDVVYVAEHLTRLVKAGTTVRAGQRIATALPGYPWTEWGWATPEGNTRAFDCYKEGMVTNSGKEMARFLRSLGAHTLYNPGPGPSKPSGRAC